MKWIKASNKFGDRVIYRWLNYGNPDAIRIDILSEHYVKDWLKINKLDPDFINLEWLDESEPNEPSIDGNFYCAEWDKVGVTCEKQCSKCKKAADMPEVIHEPSIQEDEFKVALNGLIKWAAHLPPLANDDIEFAMKVLYKIKSGQGRS